LGNGGSNQTKAAQLGFHFWRHVAIRRMSIAIGRCVRVAQVAPALKGAAGTGFGCNQPWIEDNAATADAVYSNDGFEFAHALPRTDQSLDDPVDRTAIEQFRRAARHMAGLMPDTVADTAAFGFLATAALQRRQMFDVFDTNAEFE